MGVPIISGEKTESESDSVPDTGPGEMLGFYQRKNIRGRDYTRFRSQRLPWVLTQNARTVSVVPPGVLAARLALVTY